jgi:predicted amidohydrolase
VGLFGHKTRLLAFGLQFNDQVEVKLKERLMKVLNILYAFGLAAIVSLLSVPSQAKQVKVAAVEFSPQSPGFENNVKGLVEVTTQAAQNGARLIVLPEVATTGFIYANPAAIEPYLDTIPGKTTAALEPIARQYNAYVVVGLYEKDKVTGLTHNAAVLIGPKGVIGKYRKNQLPPGDFILSSPGNLGFPVFETDIGKIALLICFDDTRLQNLLLPNLRGADILAMPIGSDSMPAFEGAPTYGNHSTIANVATVAGWLGVNVVAANIIGIEGAPNLGVTQFRGGASIWNSKGERLAAGPVTTWNQPRKAQTIYATLNVEDKSLQKDYWLKTRRPELYKAYNHFHMPVDPFANETPRQISALLVQYESQPEAIQENYTKVESLIREQTFSSNIIVLPLNPFLGQVKLDKINIAKHAEPLKGSSYQLASNLAKKYKTYLLFTMPERNGNQFYQTAVLFDFNGNEAGVYRKSHLNESERIWAQPGHDLPVFSTGDLGRIGIMIDDEVRIPEIAEVYALKRADLILIPAMFNQKEYGSAVNIPAGLVPPGNDRGMAIWYSIAKYSQAYTLVANYLGGLNRDVGQSAVYSLTPEAGYSPPNIAPDKVVGHPVLFTTHSNQTVWLNQQRLLVTRRYDLAAPLTLDMQNPCFMEWKSNATARGLCPQLSEQ